MTVDVCGATVGRELERLRGDGLELDFHEGMSFKKLDRVVATDEAVEQYKSLQNTRTGTVCGMSRDGRSVYVLRDGRKTTEAWGVELWRHDTRQTCGKMPIAKKGESPTDLVAKLKQESPLWVLTARAGMMLEACCLNREFAQHTWVACAFLKIAMELVIDDDVDPEFRVWALRWLAA